MTKDPKCERCGAGVVSLHREGYCRECWEEMTCPWEEEPERSIEDTAIAPNVPLPASDLGGKVRRFGEFELIEEIARGGMGVVYRALHRESNKIVAVKMLLSGPFSSDEFVRRFRTEAEAGRALKHPNIVSIHAVGQEDGHHYYAMEFVEGRNLSEVVGNRPLQAQRAARYVRAMAWAIHYAHERGILHRDLKPSNILLDRTDQPRILDFGLAKWFRAESDLTVTGQMLGTPQYLPPEQVASRQNEVGPACDIYSLGAILYFCLTARPPFVAETLEETLLQVLHAEPVAPRLLNPSVPEPVENICLRCLEKDPHRRYPSAQDLADDLGCFMKGTPVRARPPSRWHRFIRWCRKEPLLAGMIALVVVLLVAVASGSMLAALRIASARNTEQAERERAEEAVSQLELQRAQELFANGQSATAVAYLARVLRQDPTNRIAAERLLSALTQRKHALPVAGGLTHIGNVNSVDLSADGQKMLTASDGGMVLIWETRTGRPLSSVMPHDARVALAKYSPDDKQIVTVSGRTVRIWDAAQSWMLAQPLQHEGFVSSVEFSPDGRRLLTGSFDFAVRVWDVRSGEPSGPVLRHPAEVHVARWIGGGRVATACADGTVRIWDASNGRVVAEMTGHDGAVVSLAVSSSRFRLVTGSTGGQARVWDAQNGAAVTELLQHDGPVIDVEFSPDGSRFLTVSGNAARVWDSASGQSASESLRHDDVVRVARFSPDGRWVATGSDDKTVRVWEADTGRSVVEPIRHMEAVTTLKFEPKGDVLVTAAAEPAAWVWALPDQKSGLRALKHGDAAFCAAWSSDGDWLASAGDDRSLRVWNAWSGRELFQAVHEKRISAVEFSPDGRTVLSASWDKSVMVWDSINGERVAGPFQHDLPVSSARFNRLGTRIVSASWDRTARVWDIESGDMVCVPLEHEAEVNYAEFSPNGKWIVTASDDKTARLWEAETGAALHEPLMHDGRVFSARFNPDGTRIVTASADKAARIWTVAPKLGASLVLQHGGRVRAAEFSPNGHWVVTASEDRTARVWDAGTGRPLAEPLRHAGEVFSVAFTSDSLRVATASADGKVRIWDAKSGQPLSEFISAGAPVIEVSFTERGLKLLLVAGEHVMIWEPPFLPLPLPDWLPHLAEAVVGQRITDQRLFDWVGAEELLRLRQSLRTLPASEHMLWARRFLD